MAPQWESEGIVSEPTTTPPSRRLQRIALPALLVVALASFLSAVFLPLPWKNKLPPPTETMPPVPEFTLTERFEKPVSKADLTGKVWVASFMFTRCGGPCPRVTATMTRLQGELDLANQSDLRFVTFTMDPERDTPEVLRRYATDRAKAHPEKWLFLTGEEAAMLKLIKDGFLIGVSKSTDPKPGFEFNHSTYLVVVDKQGRIRGHFNGFPGEHDAEGSQYEESLSRLKAKVGDLLKE